MKFNFCISLFCLILFGCSTNRYAFAPEPINNPIHVNPKELGVNVQLFSNKLIPYDDHFAQGVIVQPSYSFSKYWGVYGGSSYKIEKDYNKKSNDWDILDYSKAIYKRRNNEIGFYFNLLNNGSKTFFNFNGGFCFGNFSIADTHVWGTQKDDYFYDAKNQSFYLQSAYNYFDENIKLSLGLRVASYSVNNIKTNYSLSTLSEYYLGNNTIMESMLYQPFLNFSTFINKSKSINFNVGLGLALTFRKSDEIYKGMNHRWRLLSAGFGLNTAQLFNRK